MDEFEQSGPVVMVPSASKNDHHILEFGPLDAMLGRERCVPVQKLHKFDNFCVTNLAKLPVASG